MYRVSVSIIYVLPLVLSISISLQVRHQLHKDNVDILDVETPLTTMTRCTNSRTKDPGLSSRRFTNLAKNTSQAHQLRSPESNSLLPRGVAESLSASERAEAELEALTQERISQVDLTRIRRALNSKYEGYDYQEIMMDNFAHPLQSNSNGVSRPALGIVAQSALSLSPTRPSTTGSIAVSRQYHHHDADSFAGENASIAAF